MKRGLYHLGVSRILRDWCLLLWVRVDKPAFLLLLTRLFTQTICRTTSCVSLHCVDNIMVVSIFKVHNIQNARVRHWLVHAKVRQVWSCSLWSPTSRHTPILQFWQLPLPVSAIRHWPHQCHLRLDVCWMPAIQQQLSPQECTQMECSCELGIRIDTSAIQHRVSCTADGWSSSTAWMRNTNLWCVDSWWLPGHTFDELAVFQGGVS